MSVLYRSTKLKMFFKFQTFSIKNLIKKKKKRKIKKERKEAKERKKNVVYISIYI